MAAGSVLFILETSLQLTPAYSKHWEFRKMICENHGSTCRQEMILEAFNLGFVFGQPFEKFVRSGRRSYTLQVLFTLAHEVIKDETKVPEDCFCHSECFFHVHVF